MKMNNESLSGCLVVLEGVNGSGKTTIINKLMQLLAHAEIEVALYKFPFREGFRGQEIDDYLKQKSSKKSKYDVLDMFADNRKAMVGFMLADLRHGKVVICDRYVFSAIAYQIPMHVKDSRIVKNYCNVMGYFDKDMPVPDLIYLIDGDHLKKRNYSIVERFHSTGDKAQQMHRMLDRVITNYTSNFKILKNKTDHADEMAKAIFSDIPNSHLLFFITQGKKIMDAQVSM